MTDPIADDAVERIAAATDEMLFLEQGRPGFARANVALFGAGFATFSLLYCVQPLLPLLSAEFTVTPAVSSLSLSVATGCLALAILIAGILSDRFSRKRLMAISLFVSAGLNLLAAIAPTWTLLLLARACEGFVLGGVPAVAMTYLAEEIHPRSLGSAMGLYVAGNAFGGMSGRVVTGILADHFSWRVGIAGIGLIGLGSSLAFVLLLPPSRHFKRQPSARPAAQAAIFLRHLRHPGLPWAFATAFLLMGGFVTIYNYAGYRLSAPPFSLSQSALGLLFTVYLVGMAASAWFGRLADRFGRGIVLLAGIGLMALGLAATAAASIPVIIGGICLITFGFFGAHAVASGWVGRMAEDAKAQAASLYLLAYYAGSSLLGSSGGRFWTDGGWGAVVGFVAVLLALETAVGIRLLVYERRTRG